MIHEKDLVREMVAVLHFHSSFGMEYTPKFIPEEVVMEFQLFDQTENYSDLTEEDLRWSFTVFFCERDTNAPIDSISCDTFDRAVKFVKQFIEDYKNGMYE